MRGRAVRTLLSGAAVLLVCGLANAQCTKDTDCKGDRVCEAGKCTSPVLPPAPPAPPGSETPGATAPGAEGEAAAGAEPGPGEAAAPPGTAPATGDTLEPSANLQVQPSGSGAPTGALTPLGQDEPQTRRRNRTAMITGIVMVSVGPVALLGALAAKNGQDQCDENLQRDYPGHRLPPSERYRVDQCDEYSVPLYIFGIGGALLSVGGIPLIIYGGKTLPNKAASTSLRVLPWAGPESTGVKLRLEL